MTSPLPRGENCLLDEVGEDESHPLASFMEVVGILIEKYEDDHVPEFAMSDI